MILINNIKHLLSSKWDSCILNKKKIIKIYLFNSIYIYIYIFINQIMILSSNLQSSFGITIVHTPICYLFYIKKNITTTKTPTSYFFSGAFYF